MRRRFMADRRGKDTLKGAVNFRMTVVEGIKPEREGKRDAAENRAVGILTSTDCQKCSALP